MREVEFLPEWYPKVRQRKRVVALQAWITLILVCGLGLWMLLVQRNVNVRQQQLAILNRDLSRSQVDVHRLEELLELQRQYGQQDSIFRRIGRSIEMTRVMSTLQQIMPADMALLSLNVETEEPAKPPAGSFAARAAAQENKPAEQKLRFRLHGVAPTDVDLGEFLARLTSRPFFKNVVPMYSRERVDNGHVMREFEASFVLDISPPTPAAAPALASTHAGGH
jgi:Tfp pilus assembly protein PilN